MSSSLRSVVMTDYEIATRATLNTLHILSPIEKRILQIV